MHAGTGTYVHDVVCVADCFFVVFDDDERVADIAQGFERLQKTLIVLLMQANARLVEDIQNAGKSAAYLRCKTDTLRFATAQRSCRA